MSEQLPQSLFTLDAVMTADDVARQYFWSEQEAREEQRIHYPRCTTRITEFHQTLGSRKLRETDSKGEVMVDEPQPWGAGLWPGVFEQYLKFYPERPKF